MGSRSRRWFLGAAAIVGGLSLVNPVAGSGENGGSDSGGYATTTGKSEPRYAKGSAETLYVETEYENTEGNVERPTMYGEIIRPVDDSGEAVMDTPVILTYSPYNDIRSP